MPFSENTNQGGEPSEGTVLFKAEDLTAEYTTTDENYWSVSSTSHQELTITGPGGYRFRVCCPKQWGQLHIASTDESPSQLAIVDPESARACIGSHGQRSYSQVIKWHETAGGNRPVSLILEGDIWGFDVVFDDDESMNVTYHTMGPEFIFIASYLSSMVDFRVVDSLLAFY
ncbi:hypothetical protein EDB80DRAFT_684594 [Ilyonectria destructans]|nr:hypothetical protein EDB80DRAFT_684594 [Ilyonectria destructans]